MKNYLFTVILLFLGLSLNAQAPQGFNYQATVRNSSGNLVLNESVRFSFNIIQGSQTADPTYSEDHALLTDDLGQVSLVIGQGSPTAGVFSEVDWSLGNYYLAIELDTGNGFEPMGTSQLLSVPYALYAENAGGFPQGVSNGDTLKWNASSSSWEVSSNTNSANNAFEIRSAQINYYSNNSASSGGEIIADGGSSVIVRGVVWSVDPDPIIDGDKTTDGAGSGVFTSELTNLTESTTYYYRAYATNSNRTVYGSTYSFQTMSSTDDNDGDGYSVADGDCNDLDFSINPSAFEIQDDGIDQNCDGTDSFSPVYLSANGTTVKAHSWASFGDVGTINGKEYVVADRETLKSMVRQGMDYSAVCTSLITDMSDVFGGRNKNYDISSWDTSSVTNMSSMFENCTIGVNHELNLWDVSKVADMSNMFESSDFNGYIYAWNTSSLTNMSQMFMGASSFNQSIANWNTSNVIDMYRMFSGAFAFNQNLSSWDTSNVTNMEGMFNRAFAFNQPIGDWNTSSVIDLSYMFHQASAFNQPIENWNTSSVIDLSYMFHQAFVFNQPIENWNTSSVINLSYMFHQAFAFNQNLSSWDTSNVTHMEGMFYRASAFNQPIGDWNTSYVIDMSNMFYNASAFNQNLSSWNVSNVTSFNAFDYNTPQWTLPKPNFN
jgi:surface protein